MAHTFRLHELRTEKIGVPIALHLLLKTPEDEALVGSRRDELLHVGTKGQRCDGAMMASQVSFDGEH